MDWYWFAWGLAGGIIGSFLLYHIGRFGMADIEMDGGHFQFNLRLRPEFFAGIARYITRFVFGLGFLFFGSCVATSVWGTISIFIIAVTFAILYCCSRRNRGAPMLLPVIVLIIVICLQYAGIAGAESVEPIRGVNPSATRERYTTPMHIMDILCRQQRSCLSEESAKVWYPYGPTMYRIPEQGGPDLTCRRVICQGLFGAAHVGQNYTPYINLDVSHSGFYKTQSMIEFMIDILNDKFSSRRGVNDFSVKDLNPNTKLAPNWIHAINKEIKDLKVVMDVHRANGESYEHEYSVNGLVAGTAVTQEFERRTEDGSKHKTTVAEYFKERYGNLRFPNLSLLHVGPRKRDCYIPMEVCQIARNQRVNKKLSANQLAVMIRAAAIDAPSRRRKVVELVQQSGFDNDPWLKTFGVRIDPNMKKVDARILPAPKIQYAPGVRSPVEPRDGVWDFRGQKFIIPASCDKIGALVIDDRDHQIYKEVFSFLFRTCNELGMRVPNQIDLGAVRAISPDSTSQIEPKLTELVQMGATFIIVTIPQKSFVFYSEVKRMAEIVLGVMTQCVVKANIMKTMKKQDRMVTTNIALKINTKLGGVNSKAQAEQMAQRVLLDQPTLVLGIDVTHQSPMEQKALSVASVVGNLDGTFMRYGASVRVQKHRRGAMVYVQEPVRERLVEYFRYGQMESEKRQKAGQPVKENQKPQRLIVFRDGVAEGSKIIKLEQLAQYLGTKTTDPDWWATCEGWRYRSVQTIEAANLPFTVPQLIHRAICGLGFTIMKRVLAAPITSGEQLLTLIGNHQVIRGYGHSLTKGEIYNLVVNLEVPYFGSPDIRNKRQVCLRALVSHHFCIAHGKFDCEEEEEICLLKYVSPEVPVANAQLCKALLNLEMRNSALFGPGDISWDGTVTSNGKTVKYFKDTMSEFSVFPTQMLDFPKQCKEQVTDFANATITFNVTGMIRIEEKMIRVYGSDTIDFGLVGRNHLTVRPQTRTIIDAGTSYTFDVDTGSNYNIISHVVVENNAFVKKALPFTITLQSLSGSELEFTEYVHLGNTDFLYNPHNDRSHLGKTDEFDIFSLVTTHTDDAWQEKYLPRLWTAQNTEPEIALKCYTAAIENFEVSMGVKFGCVWTDNDIIKGRFSHAQGGALHGAPDQVALVKETFPHNTKFPKKIREFCKKKYSTYFSDVPEVGNVMLDILLYNAMRRELITITDRQLITHVQEQNEFNEHQNNYRAAPPFAHGYKGGIMGLIWLSLIVGVEGSQPITASLDWIIFALTIVVFITISVICVKLWAGRVSHQSEQRIATQLSRIDITERNTSLRSAVEADLELLTKRSGLPVRESKQTCEVMLVKPPEFTPDPCPVLRPTVWPQIMACEFHKRMLSIMPVDVYLRFWTVICELNGRWARRLKTAAEGLICDDEDVTRWAKIFSGTSEHSIQQFIHGAQVPKEWKKDIKWYETVQKQVDKLALVGICICGQSWCWNNKYHDELVSGSITGARSCQGGLRSMSLTGTFAQWLVGLFTFLTLTKPGESLRNGWEVSPARLTIQSRYLNASIYADRFSLRACPNFSIDTSGWAFADNSCACCNPGNFTRGHKIAKSLGGPNFYLNCWRESVQLQLAKQKIENQLLKKLRQDQCINYQGQVDSWCNEGTPERIRLEHDGESSIISQPCPKYNSGHGHHIYPPLIFGALLLHLAHWWWLRRSHTKKLQGVVRASVAEYQRRTNCQINEARRFGYGVLWNSQCPNFQWKNRRWLYVALVLVVVCPTEAHDYSKDRIKFITTDEGTQPFKSSCDQGIPGFSQFPIISHTQVNTLTITLTIVGTSIQKG